MSNLSMGFTRTGMILTDYVQRTERLPDADSRAFVVIFKRRSTRSTRKESVVGQPGTTHALPRCQESFSLVRAFGSGTLEPPKEHGMLIQAFGLAFRDNVSPKERGVRVLAPQRPLWVSHGGHK